MSEAVLKAVPGQPDPPVVGKVTYHTIELSWSHPPPAGPHQELFSYCVQEQDVEKKNGFITVYEGNELHCVCSGLSPSTTYEYRIKAMNDIGSGQWSHTITVSTTRHHLSSDHLHKSITNDDIETARTILELDPQYLNIPDITGASPLMGACKKGRKRHVELLLSLGADVEYSNTSGKTSMMEACYNGNVECILLLREAGASFLHHDLSGMSALHWAVDGEQLEAVELLLDKGLPVDDVVESTVSGWTPLLRLCATNGNIAVAQRLIDRGADIDKTDSDGQTPLMLACLGGHKDLVSLLLRNSCNWKIKSKYDKAALDFAIAFGREEIVDLIKMAMSRKM